MCYSAMVKQSAKKLAQQFDAVVDEAAYEAAFNDRLDNDRLKICKALEASFMDPHTDTGRRIHASIMEYRARRTRILEAELFAQKTRLVEAERKLKVKETKGALENQRIATNKIKSCLEKLSDLKGPDLKPDDSRIFSWSFASMVVNIEGRKLIRPMRYLCRRAGRPVSDDEDYKGCYNARRDNLERFWKKQFGASHAIMVVTSFFEHVSRHVYEKRDLKAGEKERDMILHFNPKPPIEMYAACLWSHWELPGERPLDSFAAITDEPPPEIKATGHDRCIVPIKFESVDAWLTPQGRSTAELYAMLDDRERPYYEHQMAA